MNDPLEVLMEEHEIILKAVNVLDQSSTKIKNNQPPSTEFFGKLLEVIVKFADKCHHGKEEAVLFPLIKQKIPNQSPAISSLLADHNKGRQFISQLKEAITIADDQGIIVNADGYSRLLVKHIKAENGLFPFWMRMLSDNDKENLFEKFEDIEEKVIGLGKHEEYAQTIENFKRQLQ